jgi:hypothetical protein
MTLQQTVPLNQIKKENRLTSMTRHCRRSASDPCLIRVVDERMNERVRQQVQELADAGRSGDQVPVCRKEEELLLMIRTEDQDSGIRLTRSRSSRRFCPLLPHGSAERPVPRRSGGSARR